MIHSSSSSLSDFITPTPISKNNQPCMSLPREIYPDHRLSCSLASNGDMTRVHRSLVDCSSTSMTMSKDPPVIDSSSSSDVLSSSDDQILSRSDFRLQHEQTISSSQQPASLRTISIPSPDQPSNILYPIPSSKSSIAMESVCICSNCESRGSCMMKKKKATYF